MARVTYFVAMAYEDGKRGVMREGETVQAKDAGHAERIAERLATKNPGAVAFSRSGDPDFGEWDDAVILATFGRVPFDVSAFPEVA